MLTAALAYWLGLSLAFTGGWVIRALFEKPGMQTADPDVLAGLDPRGFFPSMAPPVAPDSPEDPRIVRVSARGYVLHRGGKAQRVH